MLDELYDCILRDADCKSYLMARDADEIGLDGDWPYADADDKRTGRQGIPDELQDRMAGDFC